MCEKSTIVVVQAKRTGCGTIAGGIILAFVLIFFLSAILGTCGVVGLGVAAKKLRDRTEAAQHGTPGFAPTTRRIPSGR